MAKKVSSKRKVILAALMAGIFILGAIVSIVLVLASANQNLSSNVTISYNVNGVGARVSARYGAVKRTGVTSMSNMVSTDGTTTEIDFYVTDLETSSSLVPTENIQLSSETSTEVVFEYRFQNTAETPFTIDLTLSGDPENNYNIKERYYLSKTQLAVAEYGRIVEEDLAKQAVFELDDILYIYIKVSVDNVNRSAAYNKDYNWNLIQATGTPITITLNGNGRNGGLTSVETIANAAVPILESLPMAPAGKGFIGYFSAATGGEQYISKDGIGLKEISATTTLYAQYSEDAVLDITETVLYGYNQTYDANSTTVLNIPSTVTEIAEGAFENNTTITTVNIGEETVQATGYASGSALKSIGAKAFAGCTNLETVTFAENIALKTIGSEAFKGCGNITEIAIPKSVTSIGFSMLNGCNSLKKIEYPDAGTSFMSLFGGVMVTPPSQLKEVVINGGDKISTGAFYYCSSLTSITIAESIKSIESNAFGLCSGLTSITIPDSVQIIGNDAFRDCTGLESLTIGNSVTTIGDNAFYNCNSLTELIIPEGVTRVGERAIQNLSALTHLVLPTTLKSLPGTGYIEKNAPLLGSSNIVTLECNADVIPNGDSYECECGGIEFLYGWWDDDIYAMNGDNSDNLQKVVLNGGSLRDYALYGCSGIETIELNAVIGGNYVFQNSSLKNIIFPERYNLYSISESLFASCAKLEKIEIPASVKIIEEEAFYHCTSLKEVIFDENSNLQRIESYAFSSCSSLTEIEIPASVTILESNIFLNCTSLNSVRFLNPSTWGYYTQNSYIDVTDANANAIKLKSSSGEFFNKDLITDCQNCGKHRFFKGCAYCAEWNSYIWCFACNHGVCSCGICYNCDENHGNYDYELDVTCNVCGNKYCYTISSCPFCSGEFPMPASVGEEDNIIKYTYDLNVDHSVITKTSHIKDE